MWRYFLEGAARVGLDVLNDDTDLDPIRKDPDCQRIVKAARELREGVNRKSP